MGEIHTKRLLEIDVIKSVSVMLIILHHEGSFLFHNFVGFCDPYLGRIGLALFTFISGYALYKNNTYISSIRSFYKKRLLRIYPLYLLALFSYVIISNFQLWTKFTTVSLAAHVLGLQMLIYPYIQPDSLLWYLGMIFIFYAAYPFLIKKSETPKKLLCNAGIILILLTLLRYFFGIIEIRTFVYFPIFIAGTLTAWTGIPEKLKNSAFILLIPLIFIRLKWITEDPGEPISGNAFSIVLSLSLMLLLLCIIFLEWVKNIRLNSKISIIISKIAIASYPVYLFHPLVLYSLKGIYSHLAKGMQFQYFNPLAFDLSMICIVTPLFFITCYYIQVYEKQILSAPWKNYVSDKLTS